MTSTTPATPLDPNNVAVDFREMAYRMAITGDVRGLEVAMTFHNFDRKKPFIHLTLGNLIAIAKAVRGDG